MLNNKPHYGKINSSPMSVGLTTLLKNRYAEHQILLYKPTIFCKLFRIIH